MTTQADPTDVVVVGGGLAGLCAAAWLARAGRRVQVLDAGPRPGGRAVTDVTDGVHFNLGPHALYIGGPADRGLADLGIARRGGKPTPGGLVVRDGVAYPMPAGPWSMLTTGALTLGQRLTLGRALTTLMTARAGRLHDVPISEYLAGLAPDPEVRAVLAATVHVATYASSPELAAGVAVSQVQAAVRRGVRYLDGGWQTLVDQLLALLRDAGVPVRHRAKVARVEPGVVTLVDGTAVRTRQTVIAAGPGVARGLLGADAPPAWAALGPPIRAACLDVALRELPADAPCLALGLDLPTYYSVHTAKATLAPDGVAVIHLAKYLPTDHALKPAQDRADLEELLTLMVPDWRDRLVRARFLPRMVVVHALPTAATGGLPGRPPVTVDGRPDVVVAGDWVGAEGFLVDGSIASARAAVDVLLAEAAAAA